MGLISTIRTSCRDCYKCVRSCPVKAIRVTDGHAEVVDSRCIADGRCVTICPQNAKKIESHIERVQQFLDSGASVAVSLAPSAAAAFELKDVGQLVSGLRKLGFQYIEETAEGAEWVAKEHLRLIGTGNLPVITSCCPAVVNLLEIYYPDLLPYLAPVVSPMVAHGRILKARYGAAAKVVFIGPCIAKKGEEPRSGAIDAVLTFAELATLFELAKLEPARLEADRFDGIRTGKAQAFPSPGGLARTVALSTDLMSQDILSIDGLDESIAFLERFHEAKNGLKLIELLACRGGCLAGPGMGGDESLFSRRERLLKYAEQRRAEMEGDSAHPASPLMARRYTPKPLAISAKVPEEEINKILARTGKFKPEDELNCGACGYNSCREKAVAIANGMAEVDMCIPYMRAKAESKAHLICQMTPNAIFVVDQELRILEVNPAAEQRFVCRQEQVVGRKLSTIIDPQDFERVLRTKELVTGEVGFPNYGMVAWQAVFYVEKEGVLIGIFADITKEKQQKERLDRVTEETLEKAQEVIDKQMRVAQEIAGLLGETTAETKVQLTRLMKLISNEEEKLR
ncbi:PAS domain S-box-containing protein [Hydrogenispora ethanolica]|uniref:PAS domain S-box-containing protein n=1 Tax=Hydrogenispora ethanolica TaxID=1082276 RepID=A0A4R1R1K1_HYDET|nr:[Fe-Fe] hydrogenase large subunit C-terminal domain-containing protein [Hydrogenispora ethanolica]TCL59223.1 PAS domain S-box-containing protein [Hydrogenispora ethanolica]